MPRFRKKPVEIEAMEYDGTYESAREIVDWAKSPNLRILLTSEGEGQRHLEIATLEGLMRVSPNDFVIKGVQGEFYPCKPDIFEASYDKLAECICLSRGAGCGGGFCDPSCDVCNKPTFRQELTSLLNKHSLENGSDTPDFILAAFLENVLTDWNHATRALDAWRKG